MKIISDYLLNSARIFVQELELSEFNAQEKVDVIARRLESKHEIPRTLAIDIACKVFSEVQAVNIPAYIDVDNCTTFCIVLREQGNPDPIYLSLASLYSRIQQSRLEQEAY
ncbi:hypothetical protein [Pelistega sp. MC2]|uniref:hypothetical protein n=1 Tax=Pelistega sp. MC2 TaxID=1720297 RepID=UPI0008DB1A50|nr:hypothetical protein [Pelistega sp. MC2]